MDMKEFSTEELLKMLSDTLGELQGRVVGLADIGGIVEAVVDVKGNSMTTARVTSLLALQTTHISVDAANRVSLFKDNDNLRLMKDDPQRLAHVVTSFTRS